MGILGQILKLTAITIFFSAAATVYVVDTDFYNSFIKKKSSPEQQNQQKIENFSKEQIKNYRQYLRNTRLEKKVAEDRPSGNTEEKTVWQNRYE